jgi:hypothetical protein
MTKKTSYAATFKDGTVITRKSHRTYTHAWFVQGTEVWKDQAPRLNTEHGFSSSERLARQAASRAIAWCKIDRTEEVKPATVI